MLAFIGLTGLRAADDKSDAKKPAATDSSKDPEAKADKKETADKDQFAVPEGKPADLVKFIEKLEQARPTGAKSQQDLIDFINKSRLRDYRSSRQGDRRRRRRQDVRDGRPSQARRLEPVGTRGKCRRGKAD